MINTVMLNETTPPAPRAKRRAGPMIAAALAALAPVTVAHAQAVGGGGGAGAILGAAVNYFENNIAADIGTLAVICIGIFLLSMRVSWMIIIGVCAGIEVIFNAGAISGALHG